MFWVWGVSSQLPNRNEAGAAAVAACLTTWAAAFPVCSVAAGRRLVASVFHASHPALWAGCAAQPASLSVPSAATAALWEEAQAVQEAYTAALQPLKRRGDPLEAGLVVGRGGGCRCGLREGRL